MSPRQNGISLWAEQFDTYGTTAQETATVQFATVLCTYIDTRYYRYARKIPAGNISGEIRLYAGI